MDNEENSIKENIIKAIQAGKVNMKPRWHFVLQTVLLIAGTILAALALLYLVSFIIFVLHQTGSWFVAGFGMHGITEFLMSFPWIIALITLIFLIILEILVRKYSFGYRKPLLITSAAVLVLVVGGGFVVANTSFHRGLFDSAEEERLPFGGGFYKEFGTPHRDNVAIGSITNINDNSLILSDRRNMVFIVNITDDIDYLDDNLQVGDSVVVFGNRNRDGSITAVDIRRVDGTEPPPPPHYLNPGY